MLVHLLKTHGIVHPCIMCFQLPEIKVEGQLGHCTCYHMHAVHVHRHGHMFKKVWQGSVQLLRLVGDDSPLGGQVLPSLDLRAVLRFGLPFPAHVLWDVAAAAAAEEHKGSQLHVLEVGPHSSAILWSLPVLQAPAMLRHAVPFLHCCQTSGALQCLPQRRTGRKTLPPSGTLGCNDKKHALGNRRSSKDWTELWLIRERQPALAARQARPSMLCLCAMPCGGCC